MKHRQNEDSQKTADELASEMGIDLNIGSPAKQESEKQPAHEHKHQEEKQAPPGVTMTQEEFNAIKAQLAGAINSYTELEKDFDNFRARSIQNVASARQEGITKAVLALTPALDSFKKAKSMLKDQASLDGIMLIEKAILSSLEKLGVKKIDAVGKEFDPNYHNATLMQEFKGKKSGTVVEEMESGYTLNDKVIKYSQVIVAK